MEVKPRYKCEKSEEMHNGIYPCAVCVEELIDPLKKGLIGEFDIVQAIDPIGINPEKSEKKQRVNGKFAPGISGNPAGKPKGARHFSTLIREAIVKVAEGDAEPSDVLIVKQLVTKAKSGDLAAIDRVIDRVDGKAEQTINLDADIHTDYQFSKEEQDALLNLLK